MLHIDGDLLVYRCGFAAEKAHYYLTLPAPNGDEAVKHFPSKKELTAYLESVGSLTADPVVEVRRELEPLKNALYNVKSVIATIQNKTDHSDDDTVVYLSGPTNFRAARASLRVYKGNRDPEHKPTYANQIKEYMRRNWNVVTSVDEEADDALATAHTSMIGTYAYSSIIASTDKDLDMVPGLHYNFVKDSMYFVAESEGRYNFYLQLLTGDTVDNVPGVPGIGPKKARDALEEIFKSGAEDRWLRIEDACAKLYVLHYGEKAKEAMLECGDLLWIRQHQYPQVPWAYGEGDGWRS